MSDIFNILNRRADKKARAEISALSARVDNIIANNNDTDGNSELVDIRIGADGNTYKSAGDAVRKQLSDTNNKLNIVDDVYSVDKLIHREVFVNDIDSEVSATVNPTVTGLRLVKGYEQRPAHSGQVFICYVKINSDHIGANKYTIRAKKVTSNGETSTFYYPKQNGEIIYDDENGIIKGQIEITATDTIGVIFQVVRIYTGSATSSYTEKWNIEYCTIMDSNVSYYGLIDKALSSTSENAVQNKVVTPILNACKPTYFLSDEWENAVEGIETAKTGKFTFIIQTDTHYVFNENETTGNDLRILTNKINLDFVAHLGDIIQGYANDSNVLMRASMMQIMDRYTNGITAPFLVAMGNHETNQQTAVGSPAKIPLTYSELYKMEFEPAYRTISNAVFPDGVTNPMYYYADFHYNESVKGVRVIVLNTQDGVNEGSFGVGNTQKTWFANTALDTTLPVIVMSHVPLVNNIADRTDYNYSSTFADIVAALQTFKSNNGTVIACLSGHMHIQASQIVDDINYIVFRNGKDKAEAVFVDLTNKTITTKAIGFSANDRSFSYT